jgi:excinuclease ABC subunit C
VSTLSDEIKKSIQYLPEEPGVYKFYNQDSDLIYVGKAKNLRKRVSSYFNKTSGINRKTKKLASEITRIEYIISNSEFDALLLENNLIKENQPKYNILLKDDKTFPYLCILNEPFPRIISTRKYIPKQGQYFGPFSSVVAMKNVLELVRKLYTIRTCNLQLTPTNINQNKFKVCLEYHLGNCKGPCVNLQSSEDYQKDIEQSKHILRGQLSIIETYFNREMQKAAVGLEYEKAQVYKEKLSTLERFQSKSLVVNRDLTNIDVITLLEKEDYVYVNYLQIIEGSIIYSKTVEIKRKLNEEADELLSSAYLELRTQANGKNLEVLSNIPITILPPEVTCTIPKIGDKRKLILLSEKNALEVSRERELTRGNKINRKLEVLTELQLVMRLTKLPRTIECFDNSNLQGTNPVASMVRFVEGRSDKKGYRHFNIKTVVGANDFASMKEIVSRRYSRLLDEDLALPDLILIDGGKGQLSSAVEALKELNLYGKIPVAGIAKRLEEIYYPEDPIPLLINKKSQALKLIQHIRDEAHRFAINFHRKKRGKQLISSKLQSIQGVGSKTMERLLRTFKSVKKINEASLEDLTNVIGLAKAKIIIEQKEKAS